MSNKERRKKLVGPWQSLHVVIWVVGLYILFRQGSFFPGILLLIAISAIYEGFVRRYAPEAYVEEKTTESAPTRQSMTSTPVADFPSTPPSSSPPVHRIDLLPQVCPSCSAPIRGHEVKWTGPQTANCPYCGTNLPMNKA